MTIHRWLRYAAIVILLIGSVTGLVRAQKATPNGSRNARVEAVWKREEQYWRLVPAGQDLAYYWRHVWRTTTEHPLDRLIIHDFRKLH